MRQSHTAVIERNSEWCGAVCSEPYEVAWASEALFFLRVLEASAQLSIHLRVQISPDGLHWCDEGSTLQVEPKCALSLCAHNPFRRLAAPVRRATTRPTRTRHRLPTAQGIKGPHCRRCR